jgi:hypothetical protein
MIRANAFIKRYSVVNLRGAFWAMTHDGKLNSESFILFLKNFMRGRRSRVFLVADGHPAHRAKGVRSIWPICATDGNYISCRMPPT